MSSRLILPVESPQPSGSLATTTVLLVDDRPFIAEAVQRMLNNEPDIALHFCCNPFQALDMAETIDPTVILLDVVMPELDGFTLCKFIRAHPKTRDKPVIMLSAFDDSPSKVRAFMAGASDYLVKLPDKTELLARVRYHSTAYLNKKGRDQAGLALRGYQAQVDRLYGQVAQLSRHDFLTGLANRNAFEERCRELWHLALRTNMPMSLILVDLDDFRAFIEHHGYAKGDESLKAVTQIFRQSAGRLSDVLARLGDGQFTALLPATQSEGAVHVAELIRSRVAGLGIPHPNSDKASHLTVSLGVASGVPLPGAEHEALLKLAEESLNRCKASAGKQLHLVNLTPERLEKK